MAVSTWRPFFGFYMKTSTVIVVAALIAYLAFEPAGGRNGGTWVGYATGTAAALMTVWLAWYGIRKRRYGKHTVPLQDMLSGHINLGVAALILATLHTGFEFEWNLHLASYGALLFISISGAAGVILYAYGPVAMTTNAEGRSLTDMIEEIAEINRDARRAGAELDDEINRLVRRSVQYTDVGGSVWRLLTGHYDDRHTEEALEGVRERAEHFSTEEAESGRRLVALMARKVDALARLRRHIRYKAWMDIWLYLHVPATFVYAIALIGHVFFVFYY